jgi:hypothetical protein
MEAERAVLEDVLFASEHGTAQAIATLIEDDQNATYGLNRVKLVNDPDFPPPGWAERPEHAYMKRRQPGTARPHDRRYW